MPQKIDKKYKLSFDDSSVFRNNLLNKNLPYIYTNNKTQKGQIPDVHETVLSNNTVSDLVDDVAINPKTGKRSVETFILLNKFSPVGGYTFIDFVDKKVIDGTPTYNVYPKSFLSSTYSQYDIFLSSDPNGSNGAVKQDSELAQIGTKTLHNLFSDRKNVEIYQNTIGKVSLNSLSDPFDISLLLSGQQPLIQRNWKITAPENVVLNLFDFATRLNGAYWPVSPIPGDYFQENMDANQMSSQTSKGMNLVNNLLGGFLGPILNTRRNPSQIFVANTGNGQKSALFKNLSYNKYQPLYDKGIIVGIGQAVSDLFNGTSANGGYYVGSADVDPMYITSPANQTPVNPYGKQTSAPVYGPAELGKLYEGNDGLLNFGLNAKPLSNGGGIDGGFVWVSQKTQVGMGNKSKPGGDSGSKDEEYNLISSKLESDKSTNLTFKTNSILDNTQRIIDSADNVIGVNKLKHVGTAINQISKVFNDGYKEITKGSKIVSYKDMTTGAQAGMEYCRVFTKDNPYYTYADLQKTDGITTSGRRFTNSVLDNTYNLNIAPLKGEGSTNIVKNEKGEKYAKKYMFSIENLAWRTSSRPGFTYDELPVCEKGPNGGRVMWFPPYNLKFGDSSAPQFNSTSFLGRPEPIYTYKDTTRSGTLSWTIIVDSPSVLNILIDKQLKGAANERVDSILNSFFAGCVKFDIYELAKRFNTLNVNDLYEIQEILNNPRLTPEELAGIKKTINSDNSGGNKGTGGSNGDNGNNVGGKNKKEESTPVDFSSFKNLMFYFENDYPNPKTTQTTTSTNYKQIYDDYTSGVNITKYKSRASSVVFENSANANVEEFFNTVIKNNFDQIAVGENCLICQLYKAVKEQKNTITLSLDGSASAPATKNYNVNLSKRRIDCIKNFFKEYTVGECSLKDFIDKEITIVDGVASGETGTVYTNVSTPQGQDSSNGVPVNCTSDITINYNGKVYSESSKGQVPAVKSLTRIAQVYSTDAMACRRVSLRIDSKSPQPEPQTETLVETVVTNPPEKVTVDVKPKKPLPTIDVKQKIKDGISKKILRNLLTECDYFEMIKENDPMIYDSLKSKIKYFNPAFHSMTPEGLNARLTFLNQCVRPGDTIPTVNQKGELIQNNAINTSFGAPPVLVLRIGDFYNTKIIPESISFSYEPLVLDLNPEGIGVQPMMVNVNLSFKLIGGMGLKEPVDQLQNALSFNYYANTEIYDERAVWTEDTSKLDKQMVDYITQNPPTNVDNLITNDGGSTIGDVLTDKGLTGEIAYKNFMDKLIDVTKSYITTTTNQLEQMTKTYNHVVTTLISKNRNYLIGNVGNGQIPPGVMSTKIYGKPDQNYDTEINKMFDTAINSAKKLEGVNSPNYIIRRFYEKGFRDDENIVQTVSENMVAFLLKLKGSYIQNASNILQTIVLNEQELVININKLNALLKGVDGKIVDVFTPKVYSISGTTNVSKNSVGVLTTIDEMAKDASTLGKTLNEFMTSLDDGSILKPMEFIQTEVDKKTSDLGSPENLALFTVLSQTMITPALLEKFKSDILSPSLLTNKKSRKIKKTLDNACEDLEKQYKKEYESELKLFTKYKKTKTYVQLTEGIESKMYPKGKDRIFKYTILTSPDGQKSDILLNLYRTISEPKNTFNNITKFN